VIVIDDHTLVAVLAETADPDLQRRADRNELFTTGSWYYRLARAARDRESSDSLSRRIESLSPEVRSVVMGSLENLPPQIGIQSPRILVPVMARLSGDIGRLNHLHAEALASALVLEAGIRVVVASEILRSACSTLGISLEVSPV
jgi:hypothetical protein